MPDENGSVFAKQQDIIDECFDHMTVLEILDALREDDSEFAHPNGFYHI